MDNKKINGLAMLLAMGIIVRHIVLFFTKEKDEENENS